MMADPTPGVVIVGAGHAGGTVAGLLRQNGWRDPITLVGDEDLPPYQRPPLSKAWLKGELGRNDLIIRPDSFYAEHDVTLRLGGQVTSVRREAKEVVLRDGTILPYGILILATGSRPRPLRVPGAAQDGVLELRGVRDADRLRAALRPGAKVIVIGGGYVGLEVAASARALGAEPVVVEREAQVLARTASPGLAAFIEAHHRDRGVTLKLGATVEGLVGRDGQVTGVLLAGGRVIPCDVALIGIGAVPNDELARDAGLDCADGIVVDGTSRTSDPAIWAIGDCSRRPVPLYARDCRLESVPSATEQAKQAAAAICGRRAPPAEVPWFWSDQFDLRLQVAGLPYGHQTSVVRGDPGSGRFTMFHLSPDRRVQWAEAVNAAADFMAARQFIGGRVVVDPAALADPNRTLRELLVS